MSYQFRDACFETVGAAANAAAAAVVGQVVPAGGVVYVVDAVGAVDGSIAYTLSDVASSATLSYVGAPSFPVCELLQASDAVEMSWGVLVAWIGVWSILVIRKGWFT